MGEINRLFNSIPFLARLRKQRGNNTFCPVCRGHRIKLINLASDREGCWDVEEYHCYACGCEWDWTFKRPFFRFGVKVRSPKWVRID